MLFLYTVLLICSVILLIAGIVEQRRHDANLAQIPTRVLVNGIRGKSSITRLCAGALRGGGLVTPGSLKVAEDGMRRVLAHIGLLQGPVPAPTPTRGAKGTQPIA